MGRKKIDNKEKNKIISVSILPQQYIFLQSHKTFDISKYFQIALQQIIDMYDDFEIINLNGGKNNGKEKIE